MADKKTPTPYTPELWNQTIDEVWIDEEIIDTPRQPIDPNIIDADVEIIEKN